MTQPANATQVDAHALFTTLYADLCRLARHEVHRNGARDILGTGTLVHEAWLDISRRPSLVFEGKGRFMAYAARSMRGLVIDQVRARHSLKRGEGQVITALDTNNEEQIVQPEFLESVGEALDELAALEPELAHVVDLRFFCGFGFAGKEQVHRQWKKARLLLYRALDNT